jgi:hypothetical protein
MSNLDDVYAGKVLSSACLMAFRAREAFRKGELELAALRLELLHNTLERELTEAGIPLPEAQS